MVHCGKQGDHCLPNCTGTLGKVGGFGISHRQQVIHSIRFNNEVAPAASRGLISGVSK